MRYTKFEKILKDTPWFIINVISIFLFIIGLLTLQYSVVIFIICCSVFMYLHILKDFNEQLEWKLDKEKGNRNEQ